MSDNEPLPTPPPPMPKKPSVWKRIKTASASFVSAVGEAIGKSKFGG